MKNKKGVSEIVSTLIIILLVIIAAGIVWVVVRNVVQSSAEQVELGSKCLGVDLQFVSYNHQSRDLVLKRGSGGDDIAGVKVVFFGVSGNSNVLTLTQQNSPFVALATKTYSNINIQPANIGTINKIEFTPYFVIQGKEAVCQNTRTATIA